MKYNRKTFNKLVNFVEKNLECDYDEDKHDNSVFFFCHNEETRDVDIFVHIQRCKYSISICIDNHQTENKFDEYCQSFRKINEAKAIIRAIG